MQANRSLVSPLVVLLLVAGMTSAALGQTLSGTVFRDFNADGAHAAGEPGRGAVNVQVFDATGALVGITATAADGTYTAALSVGAGTPVRAEFTILGGGVEPGPFGADSGTTVIFAASGDSGVDVGVNRPADYCQPDPELATSCYLQGDSAMSAGEALVSFPYSAVTPAGHTTLAIASEIGPTWGLAYQRESGSLFAGALMKRHTSFGPGGTGAIYRIVPGGGPPTVFLDLNSLFGAGTAGADPHPAGTDFMVDPAAWDPVGKIGLGDVDISDDGTTLWTINLADRMLYEIPIGIPPVAPSAGAITRTALPLPVDCPSADDVRPFATAFRDGVVYVGMVCSAESTGLASDLRGYVYTFSGGVFTEVLNIPLDYGRGCAVFPGCPGAPAGDALWNAWVPTFTVLATDFAGEFVYPQPWLTDIEFHGDTMVIGLRDRFGEQLGLDQYSTTGPPADPMLYIGDTAGDTLCASPSGATWTLESAAVCGALIGAGGANGQGPGGGEFFFQEELASYHDETSGGGLVEIPGFPELGSTAYDTDGIFEGGILYMDNADGSRTRSLRIFAVDTLGTFGKAGGLGDLEAFCFPAPVEIGNRVWLDADGDGIQDPGEPPIAGVTVNLACAAGGGTTMTDAAGQYLFNDANVAGGLPPNQACTVRLDNPADHGAGGPLENLVPTLADQGSDLHDSDASLVTGFPEISVAIGGPGANDHTHDFGFGRCGNGICESGEDCNTCPGDCVGGTSSGAVCGNGLCEAGDGEDCVSCPDDCNGVQGGKPSNQFCCGDGDGSNPVPCFDPRCTTGGFQCIDVPTPPDSFCCGDFVCEGDETCGNCALDCTIGAEVCSGGIDEDCDGAVDCFDADCAAAPECQCSDVGESCGETADCCPGLECSGGKPATKICFVP